MNSMDKERVRSTEADEIRIRKKNSSNLRSPYYMSGMVLSAF